MKILTQPQSLESEQQSKTAKADSPECTKRTSNYRIMEVCFRYWIKKYIKKVIVYFNLTILMFFLQFWLFISQFRLIFLQFLHFI